jgi:phenolic acid decarboxylase
MPVHPSLEGSTFNADLRDRHLIYEYAAEDQDSNPEKWRYEMWFENAERINYAIHGGPMAGRIKLPNSRVPMHSTWRAVAVQLARGDGHDCFIGI